MKVYLNGNVYELQSATQVSRKSLLEWPDNIRYDGQQKRKDRRWMSSWAIDAWHNGLGLKHQNTDLTSNEYRLWDVDGCDTRQPASIILSPALNTCTIVPSRGDVDLAFEYVADLYFARTTTGSNAGLHKFTPPFMIGSFADNNLTNVLGSITAIKSFGNNIMWVNYQNTAGGVDYGQLCNSGGIGSTLANVGTIVSGVIRPEIGDFGGTPHVLTYSPELKRAYFYVADQAFANLGTLLSVRTVVGTYLSPLETDGVTMFAQLPQGIYDFDDTPTIVVDTSRAQDKNGAQTIFGGNLYFKNKKSLIKWDGTNTTPKGYDLEDGLPTEQFGEITAACSSWKYIYAAVKGASYSHILTMDENNVWQYYARIPSMGLWVKRLFLSDAPDAIDRLWVIYGNHSFPGYFLNPMVAPLQAGTYSFVPTGYFTKPVFDGGMPEETGAFYDMNVTADGIGGSNKITCVYGLNGANPVSTLGVVSTTSFTHTFGSPYGVEGRRIQPKFILHGANNGTSPEFKSAVIHYLKIPKTRESFEFTIDLQETAKTKQNPLEAVIGSLNSERDSKTLLPFWYGQIGTKAVRVIDMPGLEDIELDKIYSGERTGFIRVQLAEIL